MRDKKVTRCSLNDVEKGLHFAKRVGATHAILTGKAEPTQEPEKYISDLIYTCRSERFLVDMHTNGFLLQNNIGGDYTLKRLAKAGLTMITFSVFSDDLAVHRDITGLMVDFESLIREANRLGLLVRVSLVLSQAGVGNYNDVIEFIHHFGNLGVHMVVIRELWIPSHAAMIGKECAAKVFEWNKANLVKLHEIVPHFEDMASKAHKSIVWAAAPIYRLAPLPWGAPVFAMEGCFDDPEHGVNVTFALCEENDKGPVMKSIVHKPNGHGYRNWDFNANILY
jgi:hypothetical protein